MANVIISPNMSLPVPVPGVDPGPDYANNIDSSLNIIDGHNHSPGSGVQITPQGLNINSDLSIQNNELTQVGSIEFSAPASSALLNDLYINMQSGGGVTDLFFNDGAGNVIAITKGGEVNATIASIPGESYAGGTFTWVQGNGSTTPANFDIGSITIRPNTAGTTNGVVLNPPAAISSEYDLQLPALPVSVKSIVQLDTSGNFSATLVPDNSTITISGNTLEIPAGGVNTTQLANGSVTAAKLDASAIPAMLFQTFNSSSTWTAPAGINAVYVDMWGGGAGGGGSQSNTAGGGSSGLRVQQWIQVTPGNTYNITVGGGGAGGIGSSFQSGAPGAASFFDVILAASGGIGGAEGNLGGGGGSLVVVGGIAASGGAGTVAGTNTIIAVGGTSASGNGGGGAAGWLDSGNGGAGNPFSGGNAPLANSGAGGGGAGASGVNNGGAGAAGQVNLYYPGLP